MCPMPEWMEESVHFMNVPPARLYETYVDVNRWPEWNPDVAQARLLSDGPLAVGSRARVSLKRSLFIRVGRISEIDFLFLPMRLVAFTGVLNRVWRVTEINPGQSVTWRWSFLPGIHMVAHYIAESAYGGSHATIRIRVRGPLSFPVRALGAIFFRYVTDRSL